MFLRELENLYIEVTISFSTSICRKIRGSFIQILFSKNSVRIFRKGKILKELSKDILALTFKCFETQDVDKMEIADKVSDDDYLTLTVTLIF